MPRRFFCFFGTADEQEEMLCAAFSPPMPTGSVCMDSDLAYAAVKHGESMDIELRPSVPTYNQPVLESTLVSAASAPQRNGCKVLLLLLQQPTLSWEVY